MAFAGHQFDHSPGSNEYDLGMDNSSDEKGLENQISKVSPARTAIFEAPEWIRNLTPEQRAEAENKLVRKIDLRLLPMIILMYIMNYLVS